MNKLTNYIASNKNTFQQKLQEEVSSVLDLHLPECVIDSNNLSAQHLYNELSLHSYAYHRAVWPLANTIMSLAYQGFLPNESEVINEVLEGTYIPKAWEIIISKFDKLYGNRINSTFYKQLPDVADYTGIKYLSDFLLVDRLPKIRKPREDNKRNKLERGFILMASESTIYDKGVLIKKPDRGYHQYCQWEKCENRTEFHSVYHSEASNNHMFNPTNGRGLYYSKKGQFFGIRVVEVSRQDNTTELSFVCSKHCYDALRISLKRKHQLPN
ncbi:MAG TPA: hypothetical protein VJI98_00200 [Candidatus Nanoarchaeia archaeon]|nr:hypothetical protein [Candidatus Nanoarchaeia archaeon]